MREHPYFFLNDLTKKLEKVGPFECDELEKHCRVSAKCYPSKLPALYTMAKEKFNSFFLLMFLVCPAVEKSIVGDKLHPMKKKRNVRK